MSRERNGPRIPAATYRLQLSGSLRFEDVAALVDYLDGLGVTDLYLSPIAKPVPGSSHGYDVVDHAALNPDLGTERDLALLAERLRARGMGLVVDLVPNHMGIAGGANRWWNDVLENGPSSPYARHFDIDWLPPKTDLAAKVLLPVLGDQYGRVLENQEIRIGYEDGGFRAQVHELVLPIAPRTWTAILEPIVPFVRRRLGTEHPDLLELESIIHALGHLPLRTETDRQKIRVRQREKEIVRRRLDELVQRCPILLAELDRGLEKLNGRRGEPPSFDALERLLADQAYRLSYWRVAADEINYRRFFDINELAAIRVEEPAVFRAVHEYLFRLRRRGMVTGVRIDHMDGLFDPQRYFSNLRLGRWYVVAEKILCAGEQLRRDWAIHGTTGYDFLNLLNGLFVEPEGASALRRIYRDFTGSSEAFSDVAYHSKKLILGASMSSELFVLARRLDRISEHHRWSRDFTFNSLQEALAEVIACFPVYRTYIRAPEGLVTSEDRRQVDTALREATRRNPATSASIFDFLRGVLLLEDPDGLTARQRAQRREFVMKFQQLTGPVMAKGVEDTAFYRYYPLGSLNEVGGEPHRNGTSPADFHLRNRERLRDWPHSMLATATHDTKRGEDLRARLNLLAEIPARWEAALARWRDWNAEHKTEVAGEEVPDPNEEYLFYQTVVGTWPALPMSAAEQQRYVERIHAYMNKALKEAKVHTSWINPFEAHDQAVERFVRAALARRARNRFLADLGKLLQPLSRLAVRNSLAQVLLKLTSPGVPDTYQGTELWDHSLVDPDNRRPVDWGKRRELLGEIEAREDDLPRFLAELMERPEDGRIKLYLLSRTLRFRRARAALFARGAYQPLEASGPRARHVVAFARRTRTRTVLVVATRFPWVLGAAQELLGKDAWADTHLPLPGALAPATYRDVLTGVERAVRSRIALGEVCALLPVALLERR